MMLVKKETHIKCTGKEGVRGSLIKNYDIFVNKRLKYGEKKLNGSWTCTKK